MAHMVSRRVRHPGHFDLDTAKFGKRGALRWIIREKILRPQFVAYFTERLVQLPNGGRVVVLSSRIFGKLNQRVFAAGFASCTALDGNDDNGIDDGLGFFCCCPFSSRMKLTYVRPPTGEPFVSVTVTNTLTRLTSTFRVVDDCLSDGFCAGALDVCCPCKPETETGKRPRSRVGMNFLIEG